VCAEVVEKVGQWACHDMKKRRIKLKRRTKAKETHTFGRTRAVSWKKQRVELTILQDKSERNPYLWAH
jgi:hypothetical protein